MDSKRAMELWLRWLKIYDAQMRLAEPGRAVVQREAADQAVCVDIQSAFAEELAGMEGEIARLREALEPSADTKAAYIGEFSFPVEVMDEDGNECTRKQYVPWTTIKEIMAAIRVRANPAGGGHA